MVFIILSMITLMYLLFLQMKACYYILYIKVYITGNFSVTVENSYQVKPECI